MTDRGEGASAPHPWESEPDRMADDLRYELRQVQDALQRPPAAFQPALHGLAVQRVLAVIRKALKKGRAGDLEAFERLGHGDEATPATTDSSSTLAAQVTQLTADVQRGKSELTVARSEVKRLLAQAKPTKEELAEYTAVGTVEEFRAYKAIGPAGEVLRQFDSLRAATGVTFRAMTVFDNVASQYETVLGPLLLALGRRSMALEGVLAAATDDPALVFPTHRSLLPSLSLLGDDEQTSVTPGDAIEALRAEIEERDASESDLACLPTAEQLQRLEDLADTTRAVLRERLTSEDRPIDFPQVFHSMLRESTASVKQSRATATPRGAQSPAGRTSATSARAARSASAKGASPGTAIQVESDVESIASGSVPVPPQRRSKTPKGAPLHPVVQQILAGTAPPGVPSFIPADCGRAGAISQATLVSVRSSAIEAVDRLSSTTSAEASWPAAAPEISDVPPSIADLAFVPWRLRLFEHEAYAPNTQATKTILKNTPAGRLFTLDEVSKFYKSTPSPWEYLTRPPSPLTFNRSDTRFKRLCEHVDHVWTAHAQALWERAHYFLIDPKDSGASGFLEKRRRRNSDYAGTWNATLAFLLQVLALDGIDVDLLLDPYLPWAPVYGVIALVGQTGRSVASVVDSSDEDTPEGTYFRGENLTKHPAYTHGSVERIRGKFVQASTSTEVADSDSETKTTTPVGSGKARLRNPPRVDDSDSESDDEMTGDSAAPSGQASSVVEATGVKRKRDENDEATEQTDEDPKQQRVDTNPVGSAIADPSVADADPSSSKRSTEQGDTSREPVTESADLPQPAGNAVATGQDVEVSSPATPKPAEEI